ncbi:MAG TPA: hypothetical protein VFM99_00195 [Chitinophagales bacterium]|nr:hypothetical protein [Chitinophagales bacterium]
METPVRIDEVFYTKEHLWVGFQGAIAYVGISDRLQQEMGEMIYASFYPTEKISPQNEVFGIVESKKIITRLYMPISCKVLETNIEVMINPKILNSKPMSEGWLAKVAVISPPEMEHLLSEAEYQNLIAQQLN